MHFKTPPIPEDGDALRELVLALYDSVSDEGRRIIADEIKTRPVEQS